MKQWKRAVIMGTLVGSTFTAGVFAEDVLQRVEAYLRPDFRVVLNGNPVKLENPTLIYQDSSYLPVKELGNLLGANIIYKDIDKTIYINSRINSEQPKEDKDATTDEFRFRNPLSVMVNYLGADYPLLKAYPETTTNNSLVYYRLSDVRRMGIDADGLKKSKEQLTGELYVSEAELKQRLKQLPTPSRKNMGERYVITEEVNLHKIDAIKNHINDTASQSIYNKEDNYRFITQPIIVDRVNENEFDYLLLQTTYGKNNVTLTHYVYARLVLAKMENGSDGYTVNMPIYTDLNEKLQIEEEERLRARWKENDTQ
jgi:hypothetical protein